MENQLIWINIFFAKDAIFGRKDKIRHLFSYFRISPFNCFHLIPVYTLITITISFYITKLFGGNRIPYPENELAVFIVGNFGCIHPETTDRYRTITCTKGISWIFVAGSHMECSLRNINHTWGLR